MTEQSLFERMKELLRQHGDPRREPRRPHRQCPSAPHLHALPLPGGLRPDRDADRAVGGPDRAPRAGVKSASSASTSTPPTRTAEGRVFCTSFWFTMAAGHRGSALGVAFAGPISTFLFDTADHADRRGAVRRPLGHVNYEQMTSLSGSSSDRRLPGRHAYQPCVDRWSDAHARRRFGPGTDRLIVGNFTGTLIVYPTLLVRRRGAARLRVGPPLLPADDSTSGCRSSPRCSRSGCRTSATGSSSCGSRDRERSAFTRSACGSLQRSSRPRRVPDGLARLRLRDRRRSRGCAHLRVRPDVPRLVTSWAGARAGRPAPWLLQLLTTEPFYRLSRRGPARLRNRGASAATSSR